MEVARIAVPTRTLGLTASALQLALAFALGGLALGNESFPNPPERIPRPIALTVLYALPAAVGALGALRGHGSLLGAAAATAVGAFLAFSGVTLVFLFPALLFAIASARADQLVPEKRWSFVRVALVVVVAIPVAFFAIMAWGIYAVIVLALLVFIVQFGRARASLSAVDHLRGFVLGLVIAGLMVGSGVALFATTEERCWTFHQTDGGIQYREVPVTNSFSGGFGDQVGGGCNSGVLTWRGAAIAAVLGVAAVALSAWVTRKGGLS